MSDITKKLGAILAEYAEEPLPEITRETDLFKDLGMCSLDVLNAIGDVEEAFDIEIPDEDLAKFETFEDFVAYLDKRERSV